MQQRLDTIVEALRESSVESGKDVKAFQECTADWIYSMITVWKTDAVFVLLDPVTKLYQRTTAVGICNPAAILINDHTDKIDAELTAIERIFVSLDLRLHSRRLPVNDPD